MLSRLSIAALLVGIVAGTVADRAPRPLHLELGGYHVLAVDFHTHSSTWSDGTLTPVGLVLDAERHGLDALAITGHNEILDGQIGRWFSDVIGGPTVLTGEEIIAHNHHVIAVGVDRIVDWRKPVADEVADIHRQGGIAIAAHPTRRFEPAFDAAALAALDGSEICHPLIFGDEKGRADLEAFASRGSFAAIGSSDFHGFGRLGLCRTYVFATQNTPGAILDALRAHRTVVYTPDKAYGDPALIALAATHPELRERATVDERPGVLDLISRACGLFGLIGLVASDRARAQPTRSAA